MKKSDALIAHTRSIASHMPLSHPPSCLPSVITSVALDAVKWVVEGTGVDGTYLGTGFRNAKNPSPEVRIGRQRCRQQPL